MLDLRLFRVSSFGGVSIVAWAISASMFSMFLYQTLYIQDVLGYTPLQAGLRFLPDDARDVLRRRRSPRTCPTGSRCGRSWAAGCCSWPSACSSCTACGRATTGPCLLPGFIVGGIGVGMTNPMIAETAIGVVPAARAGMASGINSTFRQFGIATGVAALGRRLLLADRLRAPEQPRAAPRRRPRPRRASSPTRSPRARSTRRSPTCPRHRARHDRAGGRRLVHHGLQRDPADRGLRRAASARCSASCSSAARLRRRPAGRARAGPVAASGAAARRRPASSARRRLPRKVVRGREVELPVVAAQPPGDERRRGAAEHRRLAPRCARATSPRRKPAENASPQPVVSTTSTSNAGTRSAPSASTTTAPSAPAVAATQPTPRSTSARQPASSSRSPVSPSTCSSLGSR